MAFTLPTFNLMANVWHYATWFGQFPSTIPMPDFTVTCNLALGRRISGFSAETMWLLLPIATDIRGESNVLPAAHGDIVEVPALSGRYYFVLIVDDAGKGFANEHRIACIHNNSQLYPQLPPWPIPIP